MRDNRENIREGQNLVDLFQNRKRYGGMHDAEDDSQAEEIAQVSKPQVVWRHARPPTGIFLSSTQWICFKTASGMEACATSPCYLDNDESVSCFKTVNGMEACATRKLIMLPSDWDALFQNRKRYGGMRDVKLPDKWDCDVYDVSKP